MGRRGNSSVTVGRLRIFGMRADGRPTLARGGDLGDHPADEDDPPHRKHEHYCSSDQVLCEANEHVEILLQVLRASSKGDFAQFQEIH